jgi:hypothetical protein
MENVAHCLNKCIVKLKISLLNNFVLVFLSSQNMSEEGQATASAAKPVDDPGMFCMSFKRSQSPTPLS